MDNKVGDEIRAENASWKFGGETPEYFSSHVRRSVPLYEQGHQLVCALSDFFVKEDSVCYDLGCAVGELTGKLSSHHSQKKNVHWIGIDAEEGMIKKAIQEKADENIEFYQGDINLFDYKPSDFIVAYYTIQFVPPRLRQEMINTIFSTLNWGGAFLMFEKVRGPDARFQDILTSLYTDYKLENGYSPDEIVAKSRSLKGVLEPFSTQGNLDLLKRAGFQDVVTVMKYICFEGFLAIK